LYRAFLSSQLVFPDKGDVCDKGSFTGDLVDSFAGSWAVGQLGNWTVMQLGSWAVNFANANTAVIIPVVQKNSAFVHHKK
jgi:hypothetical protein